METPWWAEPQVVEFFESLEKESGRMCPELYPDSDDEFHGDIWCTTCNGTGTIHGCFDDLCRSRGWDEHGADCKKAKTCFFCGGSGYYEEESDS